MIDRTEQCGTRVGIFRLKNRIDDKKKSETTHRRVSLDILWYKMRTFVVNDGRFVD